MIKNKHKKLIGIVAVVSLLIAVFLPQIKYFFAAVFWAYSMSSNSGPEAKEVIYISDSDYDLNQITRALDALQQTHNLERRDSKRRKPTAFIMYDTAIFYSLPRTDYYGFGVGIHRITKKEYLNDSRFKIMVFSNIEPCDLCADTLSSLDANNIDYIHE